MNLSKLNLSTEATKVIKQGYGFQSDLISDLGYQSKISAMTALKREILDNDKLELMKRISSLCHLNLKIDEIGAVNITYDDIVSDLKSVQDYCKEQFSKPVLFWLCDSTYDLLLHYKGVRENLSDIKLRKYELPKNAIILADYGAEGMLFLVDKDDIHSDSDFKPDLSDLSDDELVDLIDTNTIFSDYDLQNCKAFHRPLVAQYLVTHLL